MSEHPVTKLGKLLGLKRSEEKALRSATESTKAAARLTGSITKSVIAKGRIFREKRKEQIRANRIKKQEIRKMQEITRRKAAFRNSEASSIERLENLELASLKRTRKNVQTAKELDNIDELQENIFQKIKKMKKKNKNRISTSKGF